METEKTYLWNVTGYGPKIAGNKYGNREGYQKVSVEAKTQAEAEQLALPLLKETRREALDFVKAAVLNR